MKKLFIMAGLPGSGKSYVREKSFSEFNFIVCDIIKTTLPGYDPNKPRDLHDESKIVERFEINKNLENGISFVYDTTGANKEKMVKLTNRAKSLGYEVTIVYVKVNLETAMLRNSKRHRVVPNNVIIEKYEKLEEALNEVKKYANYFLEIDNEKPVQI